MGVSGWMERECPRPGGEIEDTIQGKSPPARGSFAAEPLSSAYCGGGGGPDRGGNAAWKAMGTPWVGRIPGWRVW